MSSVSQQYIVHWFELTCRGAYQCNWICDIVLLRVPLKGMILDYSSWENTSGVSQGKLA